MEVATNGFTYCNVARIRDGLWESNQCKAGFSLGDMLWAHWQTFGDLNLFK